MLLPLLVANFLAHSFTVLTLKRSILTEKISRRGYDLSREYTTDPLEIPFVREVMRTNVVVLPDSTLNEAHGLIRSMENPKRQHLFPVLGAENDLVGVVTRNQLIRLFEEMPGAASTVRLSEIAKRNPCTAFEDEPLRIVVNRIADSGFTRFPVLDRHRERSIVGMVSLNDLLRARTRNLDEERARERVVRIRMPFGQTKSRDNESAKGADVRS